MKLTASQKHAVIKLLNHYKANQKMVNFKAPTGSGKTFIISNLIAEILALQKNKQKIIIVLATLSSSQLPEQFAQKVKWKYMPYLTHQYNVEHKLAPSRKKAKAKDYQPNLIAEDQKLIIVGRSSFTKASIFIQQGIYWTVSWSNSQWSISINLHSRWSASWWKNRKK